MSIASLFKPVDSSKTRLPRTDVLERVAKYVDGKSVVSNYFDISTPELVQMLQNDLVPASKLEEVQKIVTTRLTGESAAAPKTSVGETIKNTAKGFTVSSPTKDFTTFEDILGLFKSDQQAGQSAMSPDPRATRNVREQTGWDQGYAGGIDAANVGDTTRPAPAADIDLRRSEEDRMPTVGSEFGKRGLAGVAQYLASQSPSGPIDREVPKNRQYTPSDSALKEAITGLVYGSEGVAEAKRAPEEELKRRAMAAGDVTTARMAGREAGIAALPSDVGTAAAEGTRGIVPGGAQQQAYDTQRGIVPSTSIGGRYVPPTSETPSASSASSASSATPTTDYRAAPDKPTKDDKKAIQETATAVAKNPSVGGIQSLFEQAGFSDALLQLGLGMMASKNPDFLGALGEAGQGAVALMAKQREEAKKAKLEADKLELEKQRVDIYGRSVDESGKTDKRPAIVQTSEAYSTAIKTAKEQAKNKLFDTTEQFIARDYASKQIVPAAQEAAQKAATAWDTIFKDLPSSKKKEYEEKNPKDVYVSKAYQASLQQNPELYKLLNIGVPTTDAVDLKSQYNLQLK